MSDKTKYAYLAGIVDGEGCITIGSHDKGTCINYNAIISVGNTDLQLMKWLKQTFGGNYYTPKRVMGGARRSQDYSWRMYRRQEVERLLLAIIPYMIVKKDQALCLLEFVRLPEREQCADKRKALFLRMKSLKFAGSVTTNTSSTDSVKIESELIGDNESAPAVM